MPCVCMCALCVFIYYFLVSFADLHTLTAQFIVISRTIFLFNRFFFIPFFGLVFASAIKFLHSELSYVLLLNRTTQKEHIHFQLPKQAPTTNATIVNKPTTFNNKYCNCLILSHHIHYTYAASDVVHKIERKFIFIHWSIPYGWHQMIYFKAISYRFEKKRRNIFCVRTKKYTKRSNDRI